MQNEFVNVVCMKWGSKYGPDYVNRLYNMTRRHLSLPFHFYCITDDDAYLNQEIKTRDINLIDFPKGGRGPWRKVIMFKQHLYDIRGKILFLDLDLVIINSLDKFFTFSDQFSVRHEFDRRKSKDNFGNTSAYVFESGSCPEVFDNYLANPEKWHKMYGTAEQEYVTRSLFSSNKLQFLPNEWIISFKEDCLPKWPLRFFKTPTLPSEASIVAFHGRPHPEDARDGKWPLDGKSPLKRLYKFTLPCPWIEENWK